MKKTAFIIIIILAVQNLYGQIGFRRQFKIPGAFQNTAQAAFEVTGGNYIVAGIVVDTLDGFYTNRLTLIGLNGLGQIQWTKKYGNHKFEYLENILITKCFYKQGNYLYHIGCVRDSNNKQLGVFVKFDFNGDTLWQKKYYGSQGIDIIPQQVIGSVDNGFLICGLSQDSATSTSPSLIIKTDSAGNEVWRKNVNKNVPNVHDAKAILQDSATKKIVTVGYQYIGNSSSWSMFPNVLILDSLGNKLFQLNYGQPGCLMDVIQTKDKNIVAVGLITQPQLMFGGECYRSCAIKFDLNNPSVPLWNNQYDVVSLTTRFNSVKEITDENILIGGLLDTMIQNNLNRNVYTVLAKMDKLGNVIWYKHYNYQTNYPADNNQELWSLNLTGDGGAIAAIRQVNSSPDAFFVVKYDSTGCDSSLAYCSAVGMEEVNTSTLSKTQLEIYPNPTLGKFIFGSILWSKTEIKEIKIRNIFGNDVTFSEQENQLDISSLPAGVYILQVYSQNGIIQSAKVVKE